MTIGKETYRNYSPAGMEAGVLPIIENSRVLEKDANLPDIVEVIAGDHSVKALYQGTLTQEALEKEMV